jgi:hypothetical protein
MKKLMTLMLGLSLALGSVAVTFGQTPAPTDPAPKKTKKKAPKKAPKEPKTPKKEGGR